MAKPIFIIGIPQTLKENTREIESNIKRFDDYHVIIHVHSGIDFTFQCFHEKDFIDADIEEIKEYIKSFKD